MTARRRTPEQNAEDRGYARGYRYAKEDWQKEMDELKAAARAFMAVARLGWRIKGNRERYFETKAALEALVGEP